MDIVLAGQLIDRRVGLVRRQGDLRFEPRRMNLALAPICLPPTGRRSMLTADPENGVHYNRAHWTGPCAIVLIAGACLQAATILAVEIENVVAHEALALDVRDA